MLDIYDTIVLDVHHTLNAPRVPPSYYPSPHSPGSGNDPRRRIGPDRQPTQAVRAADASTGYQPPCDGPPTATTVGATHRRRGHLGVSGVRAGDPGADRRLGGVVRLVSTLASGAPDRLAIPRLGALGAAMGCALHLDG